MRGEPGEVKNRRGPESQKFEFQPLAHAHERHGSGIEQQNISEENHWSVLACAEQYRGQISADEAQCSDGRRIVMQCQYA